VTVAPVSAREQGNMVSVEYTPVAKTYVQATARGGNFKG
jgi:hypothetical protein